MVEVFKTNVVDRKHAALLINEIASAFADYVANFDLEDCDNILRVECATGIVQSCLLINLLAELGYAAEILSDYMS